ncbi:MAG: T9SS type A sorting domain-containing protein [Flavobacteriales bacterium]|nr:T9SS type A sorting domain-containing protein [Flavobacteriales bacterium]
MYKLLTLTFLTAVVLFSCQEKSENALPKELVSAGDMSNGNEAHPSSKAAWDFQRFHDPMTNEIPDNIRDKELAFAKTLPLNANRDFDWVNRGPFNVGGRTRAIGIDVLDENVWIAGGVTGGIWRTEDAGENWTKVTTQDQIHSVTAILQDVRPGKENIWYAATGEHYTIVSHSTFETRFSGNGLLKSEDSGLTWTALESTVSNTPETIYNSEGDFDFTWRLVQDKNNLSQDIVLAAVFNGIYRTEDGGENWDQVLGFEVGGFTNTDCDYLDLITTDDGEFYATFSSDGPSKGVFRSADGINWTDITPETFPGSWGRLAMALNPLNQDEVWFFGDTDGPYGNGHSLLKYNYLSGDGSGAGGSWEDRSINLPDVSCSVDGLSLNLGLLNTQSSYDVHIAIHPTDPDVIFVAGTSIWRSTDGFTTDMNNTWIGGYGCSPLPFNDVNWQSSYPNHHPDQHFMTFLPSDDSKMLNINDGGIYVSEDILADSVQWDPKNNGYLTTQFYAVSLEKGETNSQQIIGGMQDNNTWLALDDNPENPWVRLTGGDGMFCAITEGAEYYLGCTQYGRLYLMKLDEDGSVTEYERIDPEDGPSSYNWANSYKLDPNNTKRLYWNGRNRIWRLDNLDDVTLNGDKINKEPDHWVSIPESIITGPAGFVTDIEMCEGLPNVVFYGSSNGKLFRLDSADTDSPVQTELTGEDFPNGAWLSSVSVNPYNPDNMIVCFANYSVPSIFRTTNGGETWVDISGNLEENPDGSGAGPAVIWVEYYPDGTLFAGTTTGLYTTDYTDGANTEWTFEPGIGNVVINHMDYRTYDGTFVVGTHGAGVFSTSLEPAFVGMEEKGEVAELAVFPTIAANQITVANYSTFNEFAIFDINGRMVYQKTESDFNPSINVDHLQSGTYLFVARSANKLESVKFIRP